MRGLALFTFAWLLAGCSDSVAPPPLPAPPSNLFAFASLDSIGLTWTDLSVNEETFLVEVAVDDGPFLMLNILPANSTRTHFAGPQPGHTYRFRVSACNRAGCSDVRQISVNTDEWSQPVIINLFAATSGPAALMITLTGSHLGRPADVRVFLTRADAPQARIERSETIAPAAGMGTQFIRQYFFAGLEQGVEYLYQATLTNSFGTATSGVQRVRVNFTAPQIIDVATTAVTSNSAHFLLTMRPGGLPTQVYASTVPVDSAHVTPGQSVTVVPGSSDGSVAQVVVDRWNLRAATTYKLRLTAVNDAGTVSSGEIRFTTSP